jgi:mannan endo-1,4-beta-mannosidase
MTDYHGLHNLIWVWNGQSADYLVSKTQYDIASLDIYLPADKNYSSRHEQYVLLSRMTSGDKMLALSETSSIPNMNDMFRDHCIWSFFGLWYGEYLMDAEGNFSEKYTKSDVIVELYNSEAALTLTDTAAYFLDGEELEEIQKATVAPTQPTEETEETEETTTQE